MASVFDNRSLAARRGFPLLFGSVVLNALGLHAGRAGLKGSTPLTVSFLICLVAVAVFLALGAFWRLVEWRTASLDQLTPGALLGFLRTSGVLLIPAGSVLLSWWNHVPESG